MRVLLTCHRGYLGTATAPILAAAGHAVSGLETGLFADVVEAVPGSELEITGDSGPAWP